MKLLHRRLHVFTTSPRWQPSVEWTVKNARCIVFSSSHMTRMKHIHCTSNNNAAHYRLHDANLLAYLAATRLITSDLLGFLLYVFIVLLLLFTLSGSQFNHPHLLRRLPVRRLLRRGHLWDGLRHSVLRHLHDGAGQAVPSSQLGLECELFMFHTRATARLYKTTQI